MSSTTTESVQQRGPVTKKAELEDALMKKIIDHFCQLTSDSDFKNASATYSQVKEQQEQIRTRDEELTRLQKDIEAQREGESLVIRRLSAANQDLAIQKEIAEKRIVSLQKENAEKEKSLVEISRRIQELQRQLQSLLSERSKDEKKMSSMIAQHNLEIDSFQRKLKERDASIDKLKESDDKLTSLLSDEKAKRGNLEKDKTSLEEKVLKAHSRLEKFDSLILKHDEIDEQSITDEFSSLWDFAVREIWTVLRQDLNEENFRNDGTWNKFRQDTEAAFRDGAIQRQRIPLCASNSEAAKGMRLAVMLGILSRQIDEQIFQPIYFPSETGYIRMNLNKLVKTDTEKEHFYRSVLRTIDRDGQEAELRSRANSIVQIVSHYLYEIVSTTQYGELRERIKNVVDKAIEVWRPIQNSTKRYETGFDPADWGHEEDFLFQFPGGGEDPVGAEHQNNHFLVIFPGLYCLESEAFVLTSVVPLTSSQKLYVTADQELREELLGKASPTRKQTSRKRQNSVAKARSPSNGTNFLGRHSGGSSN